MAKSNEESTVKTPTAPKLTIHQFLGTVSMNHRDKWVVKKIYAKNTDEKTPTQWIKELNINCKGITINK